MSDANSASRGIGLVVIGRNEGDRLRRAITSLPSDHIDAVYVDSASTDGSIELARSLGMRVLQLDPSRRLSAARARREGVEFLRNGNGRVIEFVQFLDGDCELNPDWLDEAVGYLAAHDDVAAVCGRLSELEPERSIYNWLSSMQWQSGAGDIESCGGVFMIRLQAYDEVGGFNPGLLTGEEPELCSRLRQTGWRIARIDVPMASHDSGLLRFSDWWRRAVWGGFGDAIEFHTLGWSVPTNRRRETRSALLWGLIVPLLMVTSVVASIWIPWFLVPLTFCAGAYGLLFLRILRGCRISNQALGEGTLYAFFCILRKHPCALGFALYWLSRRSKMNMPDPHEPAVRPHGVKPEEERPKAASAHRIL